MQTARVPLEVKSIIVHVPATAAGGLRAAAATARRSTAGAVAAAA